MEFLLRDQKCSSEVNGGGGTPIRWGNRHCFVVLRRIGALLKSGEPLYFYKEVVFYENQG
ncbi:MAG: hypothetical protein B5M49_01130 [Thermotoga sp. 4484_232]|nr:MAG: hypothetical protein B5M49_01130 [Thermotoga sp. 4484_232]RKX40296.1 MAG: hypothetical protein DRP23_03435 [Thermotogota bacterium]